MDSYRYVRYTHFTCAQIFRSVAELLKSDYNDGVLLHAMENFPATACYQLLGHLRYHGTDERWKALNFNRRMTHAVIRAFAARVDWVSTEKSMDERTVFSIPAYVDASAVSYFANSNASTDISVLATHQDGNTTVVSPREVHINWKAKTITFPVQESSGILYSIYLYQDREFPRLTEEELSVFSEMFIEHLRQAGTPLPEIDLRRYSLNGMTYRNRDFQGRINYSEYIKSNDWHRIRHKRMLLDNLQCVMCGTAKNLIVHHITYERLGHEDIDDLITLCEACHAKVHENDLKKKQ